MSQSEAFQIFLAHSAHFPHQNHAGIHKYVKGAHMSPLMPRFRVSLLELTTFTQPPLPFPAFRGSATPPGYESYHMTP